MSDLTPREMWDTLTPDEQYSIVDTLRWENAALKEKLHAIQHLAHLSGNALELHTPLMQVREIEAIAKGETP